jgi:glycosyltransferase involved in cell wall biosynthesis
MRKYKYVLITPARNEELYIETTLKAVIEQEYPPEKWVIVSDGSTDRTDEIVQGYAAKYPFIHFLRREPNQERDFGSKVYAIRAGISAMTDVEYDFIGNLDADISFHPDYFLKIQQRFHENPQLGLTGGVIYERDHGEWRPRKHNKEWSVAGAVQFFRRGVYESIGGYLPLSRGGEDTIAATMARMKGWEVRTFPDIHAFHHRTTGTAETHFLGSSFRRGIMEYINGDHPLFQAARFFSRILSSPLASIYRTAGYLYAMLKRLEFVVPVDVIKFVRKEQIQRLESSLPWKKIR